MVETAKKGKRRVGRLVFVLLSVYFLVTAGIAATNIISTQRGYAQAQDEYRVLRQYAPQDLATISHGAIANTQFAELLSINPEFIGWISIEGTSVDYPVVLGRDNSTYLYTTFSGEENYSGAVFMDYRSTEGFESAVSIIYAHNMKDGSMFADLNELLDNQYREAHPKIVIVDLDGVTHHYSIHYVKLTDMYDEVYGVPGKNSDDGDEILKSLGFPPGVKAILLSTCTNSGASTERLLIYAVEK